MTVGRLPWDGASGVRRSISRLFEAPEATPVRPWESVEIRRRQREIVRVWKNSDVGAVGATPRVLAVVRLRPSVRNVTVGAVEDHGILRLPKRLLRFEVETRSEPRPGGQVDRSLIQGRRGPSRLIVNTRGRNAPFCNQTHPSEPETR